MVNPNGVGAIWSFMENNPLQSVAATAAATWLGVVGLLVVATFKGVSRHDFMSAIPWISAAFFAAYVAYRFTFLTPGFDPFPMFIAATLIAVTSVQAGSSFRKYLGDRHPAHLLLSFGFGFVALVFIKAYLMIHDIPVGNILYPFTDALSTWAECLILVWPMIALAGITLHAITNRYAHHGRHGRSSGQPDTSTH